MDNETSQQPLNNPVILRQDDKEGITTVTLNRPAQYNALSEDLLLNFQSVLNDIASNSSVRVVVLAGAGNAFCAGHDLKEMRNTPNKAYYQQLFERCSAVMLSMIRLPQPIIAQVHGMATAAGCQLVANSDLAVASTEARFAVSGINLGLFCSTPAVALSRNVSRKRAFEMLMTGQFINAQTAVDFGLINQVVAPNDLHDTVERLATTISRKSKDAVKAGKTLFYKQLEYNLTQAYTLAGETMACNMLFDDATDCIDAFIEKRDPD